MPMARCTTGWHDALDGRITHAGEMWNYAAGFPHPFPHFEGHGLDHSQIGPCGRTTGASASAPSRW